MYLRNISKADLVQLEGRDVLRVDPVTEAGTDTVTHYRLMVQDPEEGAVQRVFRNDEIPHLIEQERLVIDRGYHSLARQTDRQIYGTREVHGATPKQRARIDRMVFLARRMAHYHALGMLRTREGVEAYRNKLSKDDLQYQARTRYGTDRPNTSQFLKPLPAASTLLRYDKLLRMAGGDPRVFQPSLSRSDLLDPQQADDHFFILGHLYRYEREPSMTKEGVAEATVEAVRKENAARKAAGIPHLIPERSARTYERYIDKYLDPYSVTLHREGEAAARRKFGTTETGVTAEFPGQKVQMDFWNMHILTLPVTRAEWRRMTADERRKLKPVRRWIVVVIDVATRVILGYAICRTPNQAASLQALRMCFMDKTFLLRAAGITKAHWNFVCPLIEVTTDSGSEFGKYPFGGSRFSSAVRRLTGSLMTTVTGLPHLRGHVERWNSTADRGFARPHAGYTGSNPTKLGGRKPHDVFRRAILALTHFRCSWVSCGTEHSRAEEVELGSTVHLTFDEFQLGDVALGRAVGPWEAERGGDSRLIGAQPASEAGHGTGGGIVKPGFEAVRVTPPDHCLEPVEEMAGRGENGNGVLDDRNGDRVFPGEVIKLPGEHHRDLPCGGALSGTGRRRRLGAAPTISPFRDDAQATAEAAAPESSPEFGAVPAAARPSLIELDEPGLERTRADAEDVVAFAAQDAADGLPAAAGPNNDLLDRHALVRQRPNGRIRLLAAQEAVVLQPLSRGQQLRTDLPGAERPADRGHRPLHCVEEGSAGVLHQVPAVGDLRDLRGGADDRLTVAAAAVARDDLDGRMIRQPRLDRSGLAVGKQVDNLTSLQIADDGAVAMPALPGPVVDADNPGDRLRLRRPRANHAQQRVLADRHEQAPGQALAGAAAEREAEMVNDALQPRRAARIGCDDVIPEPLGEDHPGAAFVPAPETPDRERDPDAPAISREVGKRSRVPAVDPARRLTTIRTHRSALPRARNGSHTTLIYLHMLDNQPRRQQRRRQSAPTHLASPRSGAAT
jgi:transposase InsO family protein